MGCWGRLHPSMPHHCSLDGNHRTQTSSCGRASSKQQHLALWQTEQAVALVASQLPLGLSQGMAADKGSGFSSPFAFYRLFLSTFWASEAWGLFPLLLLYVSKYSFALLTSLTEVQTRQASWCQSALPNTLPATRIIH